MSVLHGAGADVGVGAAVGGGEVGRGFSQYGLFLSSTRHSFAISEH